MKHFIFLSVLIFSSYGYSANVCNRTPQIKQILERKIQKSCTDITVTDLAKIQFFEIDYTVKPIVTELKADDFQGLVNLQRLDISDAQLIEFPAGLFNGLKSLKSLYLNTTKFTALPAGLFTDLESVHTLSIMGSAKHSVMTAVDSKAFVGLKSLRRLTLAYHAIEELPADLLHPIPHLERLDLGDNRLFRLPPNFLNHLTSLRELDLAPNLIKELEPDALHGLFQLEVFSPPYLMFLHKDTFRDLSSLDTLFFSNRLQELESGTFSGTPRLRKLHMEGIQSKSLPADLFKGLHYLEQLDMGSCALNSLPVDIFQDIPNLRYLDLSYCTSLVLPSGVFSGLTGLQYLYLGNIKLTEIQNGFFKGLEKLRSVDLSNTGVQKIEVDALADMPNLWRLHMNRNKLQSLEPGQFAKLPHLRALSLAGNLLQSLPEEVFAQRNFSKTAVVALKDNPLTTETRNMLTEQLGARAKFDSYGNMFLYPKLTKDMGLSFKP